MTTDPRVNSENGTPETEAFEAIETTETNERSRKEILKNQLPHAWKWILAAGLILVLLAALAGFMLMYSINTSDHEVTIDKNHSVSRPAPTTKNKYQTGDQTSTLSHQNHNRGNSGSGSGYGTNNIYGNSSSAGSNNAGNGAGNNTNNGNGTDNGGGAGTPNIPNTNTNTNPGTPNNEPTAIDNGANSGASDNNIAPPQPTQTEQTQTPQQPQQPGYLTN